MRKNPYEEEFIWGIQLRRTDGAGVERKDGISFSW
jgi:hypothetical protein